jgi:hypothetical protein
VNQHPGNGELEKRVAAGCGPLFERLGAGEELVELLSPKARHLRALVVRGKHMPWPIAPCEQTLRQWTVREHANAVRPAVRQYGLLDVAVE